MAIACHCIAHFMSHKCLRCKNSSLLHQSHIFAARFPELPGVPNAAVELIDGGLGARRHLGAEMGPDVKGNQVKKCQKGASKSSNQH